VSIEKPSESFAGLGTCIILAGLICIPILGVYGLVGALGAFYFALLLVNGADSSAKKHKNKHRRRR